MLWDAETTETGCQDHASGTPAHTAQRGQPTAVLRREKGLRLRGAPLGCPQDARGSALPAPGSAGLGSGLSRSRAASRWRGGVGLGHWAAGPCSLHRPLCGAGSACGSVGTALAVLGWQRWHLQEKGFSCPKEIWPPGLEKFWRNLGMEMLMKAWGSPPETSLGHVFVGSSLEIRKPV